MYVFEAPRVNRGCVFGTLAGLMGWRGFISNSKHTRSHTTTATIAQSREPKTRTDTLGHHQPILVTHTAFDGFGIFSSHIVFSIGLQQPQAGASTDMLLLLALLLLMALLSRWSVVLDTLVATNIRRRTSHKVHEWSSESCVCRTKCIQVLHSLLRETANRQQVNTVPSNYN